MNISIITYMTNNLKILTILSIFVFILTGYFCFSSSFTKNQIIVNNKKDNKETTIDTNNKDNNNNEDNEGKEEVSSKLSILNIVILIVILIIVIAVIVFIIIKFKSKYAESETDFAKDNFCPTFFLIKSSLLEEENKDNAHVKGGDYFFKILAERILPKNEINNIKSVMIYLDTDNYNGLNNGEYTISLKMILEKIAEFAAFTKNIEEKDIDEFAGQSKVGGSPLQLYKHAKEYVAALEKKYGEDFDNYLCFYLLYYLDEEMQIIKTIKEVKIYLDNDEYAGENTHQTEFVLRDKVDESKSEVIIQKSYRVNYTMIFKKFFSLGNAEAYLEVEYEGKVIQNNS